MQLLKVFGLSLILLIPCATAHSWLDCLDHREAVARAAAPDFDWIFNASNTQGVCQGYARDYPSRADMSIGLSMVSGGFTKLYFRGQSAPLCPAPVGSSYGSWRHILEAAPGDTVFFSYTSNGHIVRNDLAAGTNVTIWWRADGRTIATTLDLGSTTTPIATAPFADGVCGESTNAQGKNTGLAGVAVPCVHSFVVPDAADGEYSFLWSWEDSTGVIYWSCFDVSVKKNLTTPTMEPLPTVPLPSPSPSSQPSSTAPTTTSAPSSSAPTQSPTPEPTTEPTPEPTPGPTPEPTQSPTSAPAPGPCFDSPTGGVRSLKSVLCSGNNNRVLGSADAPGADRGGAN